MTRENKFWIIALPRDRLDFCLKVGTFGLTRKGKLDRVSTGDSIAFLTTKDNKIVATGSVTKDYYYDDSPVFTDEDLFDIDKHFNHRFLFSSVQLPPTKQPAFRPLIKELAFIKNPAFWSVHFQSGIAEIPESDWNIIQREINGL